ncbi:MAG: uroporphyrinogen decarboxylase family protein, partial [Candidatus Latescibacterota bacterium]
YGLQNKLGIDCDNRITVVNPYQMLGEINETLRRRMFIDVIGLSGTKNIFGYMNSGWKEWTMFDGTPVLVPEHFNTIPDKSGDILMYPQGDRSVPPSARMPKGGYYFDAIIRQKPIDEDHLDPADNLEEFGLLTEEDIAVLSRKAEYIRSNTDYAVIYGMNETSFGDVAFIPGPGLTNPKGIRDIEEWYISLLIRRDYVYEVFDRLCEYAIANLERVHQAAGNCIDIFDVTETDFGTQRGPFVSPDLYRDLFQPFHKRICDWIHTHTNWKTFMHSCGGVRPLIPDFIEAGFDILNPVQCSAEGMDAQNLKNDFGEKIVFWGGGIDTQQTLPFGSPEEVYSQVRERIDIFNRGGGYVFNPIHNIQAGTPAQNIMSMLEALEDSFPI